MEAVAARSRIVIPADAQRADPDTARAEDAAAAKIERDKSWLKIFHHKAGIRVIGVLS